MLSAATAASADEAPFRLVVLGLQFRLVKSVRVCRCWPIRWPVLANPQDGMHRTVHDGARDRIAVLVEYGAVADERGVAPVIKREIPRRVLRADTEAITDRPIETNSHTVTTASTS